MLHDWPDRMMLGGVEWYVSTAQYTYGMADYSAFMQGKPASVLMCNLDLTRIYTLEVDDNKRAFTVHSLPSQIETETHAWIIQEATFSEIYRTRGYNEATLRLNLLRIEHEMPKNWLDLVVDDDDPNVG